MNIFKWDEGSYLGDTFQLQEKIGKGTYGVVGKAIRLKDGKYKKTGDIVALKVPFDQEIGEDNLKKEPETVKLFNHESIVKAYEHHNISGFFVIEMEFIDGNTLSDLLDSKNFGKKKPLSIVLGWIKQISLGLKSMGSFSHGDIKPQNIIISKDGMVKLVDFGTSRRLEDVWVFTRGQGTEEYMAPEVALDNKRVSMKSDLYSIGVILYEMVTGEIPFRSNLERLEGKKLIKPREINSSISVELEEIILKCLEREPDFRYHTWDLFIKDLDKIIKSNDNTISKLSIIPESKRINFRSDSSSPLQYLNDAKTLMLENKYSEAIKKMESAVKASEEHPNYLRMLAALYLRADYHEKAKETFNKLLVKYDNGYPVEREHLSYILKKLGDMNIETKDFESAIKVLKKLEENTNDKEMAKFKLAIAYGLNAEYKKSIKLLEEIYKEIPDSVLVCRKLGWAYRLSGNDRQSISYYNQALAIESSDLASLYGLGEYYFYTGDHKKANKYFEKINKYDINNIYSKKLSNLIS